jgi:thiol-disulfide isomerase/thioredoxin
MYYNLTETNIAAIHRIIKEHNNVTILYYSDMCGYCIALKPVWAKVCKKCEKSPEVAIINVENNNIKHLDAKYRKGIGGFPTIIKYDKGKKIAEYEGNRTMADIGKFIKK